jgi:hypothetical protein
MRISALIFIFLCFQCNLYSQDVNGTGEEATEEEDTVTESVENKESTHAIITPDALPATRTYQAQPFSEKKFDNDIWQKIIGDTDYKETKQKESKSISMPQVPWAGPVLRIISYLAIISVVILLLYNIIKNTSLDFRVKNNVLVRPNIEKAVEDIEEIEIDSLLERARREGNFKLAVRLYYLGILKKLNTAKLIVWKKDKTNRDYLFELFSGNHYFAEVSGLTASYEAVWYGEHALTSESFQALSNHFEDVSRKISEPANV